ncbi:UL16-binding protein 6-like [Nycticebus coucang]|uniref:UL16-binding protein 6-like n=1 Tax=Nycticebus coucang TaxID=9470 RepID=UPI00234CFB98|nr:UL16-binding protein 6-like [Nycticebus coucang]
MKARLQEDPDRALPTARAAGDPGFGFLRAVGALLASDSGPAGARRADLRSTVVGGRGEVEDFRGSLGRCSPCPGEAKATGDPERETHSLCCNFTITPKFRSGPGWCEVQGQSNEIFLRYYCSNKTPELSGALGKEINGTEFLGQQKETLTDVVELLTKELLEVQLQNYTPSAPPTWQVRMCCWCEANGSPPAFWLFGHKGQTFLRFNSENKTWTLLHDAATRMKKMWENNKELMNSLFKVSMGDCKTWLANISMPLEKMELTAASSTQATQTAGPMTTGLAQATESNTGALFVSIAVGVALGLTILLIIWFKKRKVRTSRIQASAPP